MNVGLVIGKHMSMGCPGKNVRPVLGRPMVEYAFIAAAHTAGIDRVFTSTDSPHIAEIGARYGAEHIARPPELATPEALTEDALTHAFDEMQKRTGGRVEIVALLFANSPTIRPGFIDRGIDILRANEDRDSVVTVTKYNMWAPLRARRIAGDGLLKPAIDLSILGDTPTMSSIRGGEGDTYYCDLAVQVLRARCFTEMDRGALPFKWMGTRIHALETDYGFDIDYEWQIPVVEHWLKEHGFSEQGTPYDHAPKPGSHAAR